MNASTEALVDLARMRGFDVEPHPTTEECWVLKEAGTKGDGSQLVLYQVRNGVVVGLLRPGQPSRLISVDHAKALISIGRLRILRRRPRWKDDTR